jgi:D-amino-acid oxidase
MNAMSAAHGRLCHRHPMVKATRPARPDVLVIGAGVTGLTTAVCLAEDGLTVRVDSDLPPGATTSAAAGAAWDPFMIEPQDRVRQWSEVSLADFAALADRPQTTGVRLVSGTHQSLVPRTAPDWTGTVGAQACTPAELRPGYAVGWRYTAPVIDMPHYLGYLVRRLAAAGGRLRTRRYGSPAEALAEAPVVVNCSGSGARALVPDPATTVVRGQIAVVENPGITEFFCDDTPDAEELVYAYPHGDTLVLGGTAEPGVWDLRPDPSATAAIIRRCAAVLPQVRDAAVLAARVGLRPVRPQVRLAADPTAHGRLLHNYGHGGAGVTVSWGCAREVAALLRG